MDKETKESQVINLSKTKCCLKEKESTATSNFQMHKEEILPGLGEKTKALACHTSGGKANRFQVWSQESLDGDTESSPASAIG